MKRIYFVRHGQSKANVEHRVQGLDDPLTDEGKHQANKLAVRAQQLGFDAFFSSDATRAVETAKAIAAATKKEFTEEPLFREVQRPTRFIGISRETEEYQSFLEAEHGNIGNPDWQFEDGEHFFAARERALTALSFLEEQESDNILVVTHGYFTRYMVATILMQKQLVPEAWGKMRKTMVEINTGITMCTYTDDTDKLWRLVTWNDFAHFAE